MSSGIILADESPPRRHSEAPEAHVRDAGVSPVPWLQVGLLAAITLGVRLVQLDHTPYIDELNHALAARVLLTDGTLVLGGDMAYTRSWVFTYIVAGSTALFGDNLVAARLPAVLAGVGLVVALFLWVRAAAGAVAAWVSALLLCFAPISLYLSQQVRFYTLQTLLFFVGSALVYLAAEPGRRRASRGAMAGAALACFALAFHLQPITAVGVATLGVWLLLDRGGTLWAWVRQRPVRAIAIGAGLAAFVLLTLVQDVWSTVLRNMRYADLWADANRENLRYYHDLFLGRYPTLWTLYPVAVLLAASRYARATIFCLVLFTGGFVFHSIAAWKHERYLFYVMPFLFATWGMAAAVALPWLRGRFEALARSALARRTSPRMLSAAWALGLLFAVAFAAYGNPAVSYTYRMLTVSDEDWTMSAAYRGESDWAAVLPQLQREAQDADVVMTSAMLKAMYFMNRADMGLSAAEVLHGSPDEFSIAPKEGIPVISRVESLEQVHRCVPRGLVIADRRSYRRDWGVTPPVADYLEANGELVPLEPRYGVIAFRLKQPAPTAAANCDALLNLLPARRYP